MSLYCHECGSSTLRQAHFRIADTLRLLIFQYPVRCRTCRRRWHAFIADARLLPAAPHRRENTPEAS